MNLACCRPVFRSLVLAVLFVISSSGEVWAEDVRLLVDEGFERGGLYHDGWWQRSGNHKGRVTEEFAREGRSAARFEVKLAEQNDYRCEITPTRDGPGPRAYPLEEEFWYGFSIMPAPGLRPSPRAEVVYQFHNTPDPEDSHSLNPCVALRSDGQQWLLDVRGDSKAITRSPVDYEYVSPDMDMGPVAVGEWTDWVMAIKWSPREDGRLRLWKNGELVYDGTHPNCYLDERGPYLKFGVYAWYLKEHRVEERRLAVEQEAGDRIYYYDSVRIARGPDALELVAPR